MHPRAYKSISNGQFKDIPEHANVIRAFSLDTARHLSVRNRYPGFMALLDHMVTMRRCVRPDGDTTVVAIGNLVHLSNCNRAPN